MSDRENKLRYLYNFVGLKPAAYLFGNFLFDIIPYIISTGVFIAMLFIMKLDYLSNGWVDILGIMASFGVSIITLTYLVSFIFKKSVYAFNKIGIWYVIFGLVLPMVLTIIVALPIMFATHSSIDGWQALVCMDPFVGLALGLLYEVILQ